MIICEGSSPLQNLKSDNKRYDDFIHHGDSCIYPNHEILLW